MSKLWVNEEGDVVHPNAPRGGGGLGSFKAPGPIIYDIDTSTLAPHPHSPAGRLLALDDRRKQQLKKQLIHRARPKHAVDQDALNAKVAENAKRLVGKPAVGRGECTDLAERVLKSAGGETEHAFGDVTETADYTWGIPVSLQDIKPGDILQFRDYHVEIVTEIETTITKRQKDTVQTEVRKETDTATQDREHHTAVVVSNEGMGKLTIVEQNVMDRKTRRRSKVVVKDDLFISSRSPKSSSRSWHKGNSSFEQKTTITITVAGSIWAYRPQAEDVP